MTEPRATGPGAGRGADRGRSRPVTLGDVASAAGVSVSTVSRVFSRPDLLSGETVDRIRAIAGDLGYLGNHAARALVTGRFQNIAMVVPDIANPFYPPLVRAIQNRADQLGYAVFLGDSDERADRERTLLSRLAGQVDGFILAGTRLEAEAVVAAAATRPTVLVNRDIPEVSRVLIDARQGVQDAVRHLHRLGHRRIAYLAGPADSWANQERQSAAETATAQLGMDVDVLPLAHPDFEGGRAAADPLIDTEATAAIAFDDVIAQGLLTGLRARGISVPGEMSVIGCDDTLAVGTDPALTTISHSSEDAGARAVELLLSVADGTQAEPARLTVPTRLVHRQTTAAPARG